MASSDSGVPLPSLNWEYKDQTVAFNEWKDFLESFFAIKGVENRMKWHYILLSSGPKGRELWNNWSLTTEQKEDADEVFKKFKEYLIGTPNQWVMRLELSALKQGESELIDDFICRLRSKAKSCSFTGDTVNDNITFQMIKGIKWPEARRKLISKGNTLTLDGAIKCAQEFQATMQNTTSFQQQSNATSINAFQKRRGNTCSYCKTSHPPKKCPAFGKTCEACGKKNHVKIACRGRSQSRPRRGTGRQGRGGRGRSQSRQGGARTQERSRDSREVHAFEDDDTSLDDLDLAPLDLGSVVVDETIVVDGTASRQSIMAKLEVRPPDVQRKVSLRVKADTGANGNLLPMRCLKQIYPDQNKWQSLLSKSNVRLTAVNGTKIEQFGYIDLPLRFDGSEWLSCRFYVYETDGPAILSCDASEKLGIVHISNSINISATENAQRPSATPIPNTRVLKELYPDRFEGIGNMPGEYNIELKKDAEPHITAPRKYPIQLRGEICDKLKEMENMGVITKCSDEEASEWVNALAFSRKASGELRICLDPRKLNQAIKRTYHKVPTSAIGYQDQQYTRSWMPRMATGG